MLGSWLVQQPQKVKEKDKEEKEKEQSKEAKDTKDHKDSKEAQKDHPDKIHPPDKLPELLGLATDPMALIQQLAQRMDALEQRLASGQAFIQPAERPPVGQQALRASDQGGEVAPAGQ